MQSLLLRRMLAYFADCVLLFAVLAPTGFAIQYVLHVTPDTPQDIYATLLLNFSIPAWGYFTWGDQSTGGATLGKRLLNLHATTITRQPIGIGRALGRTAVKMLPWEMAHLSAFLLAPALGTLGTVSWIGLGLAYALIFTYLGMAWWTTGHRSVHDFAAATLVNRALSNQSVARVASEDSS